jgi:hypothetical protein
MCIKTDIEKCAACVRFEVFTAVTMKNTVFWDLTPLGFVITDVSKERIASIIRVEGVRELGTTLAVTSSYWLLVATYSQRCPSLLIPSTLMIEVICPPKR